MFSRFTEVYLTNKNFIYLRYTTCFYICIHCDMITTIKLINTPITLHTHDLCVCVCVVCVMRIFKINSLRQFQVHNTVSLTIVTVLSIKSSEFIYPTQLNFCTLWWTSPHCPLPIVHSCHPCWRLVASLWVGLFLSLLFHSTGLCLFLCSYHSVLITIAL